VNFSIEDVLTTKEWEGAKSTKKRLFRIDFYVAVGQWLSLFLLMAMFMKG
jgi:hypothetical protein